jgi:hypothetical protein
MQFPSVSTAGRTDFFFIKSNAASTSGQFGSIVHNFFVMTFSVAG